MSDAASVRMNISLPTELKREMDTTKETVNWSNVAAEAFRHKLLELQSSRKGPTMEDVIARLRAAAQVEGNASRAAGYSAGEEWAKQEAKPSELRRLYNTVFGQNGPHEVEDFVHNSLPPIPQAGLFAVITGDDDSDYQDARSILAAAFHEMTDDPDYIIGFVDGATDVWHRVRDEI